MVRLDGTETCSYCGKRADEILNFNCWRYVDNRRYCNKHGCGSHYVFGNLDINSSKGLGRAGEVLVVKTLGIGKEYDCNRISCGFSFDMYNKKYGKIDVKTRLKQVNYNKWQFDFKAKKEANSYICIGLSSNRKNVEHVWIVPNINNIKNLIVLTIINTHYSLSVHKHWEVDSKPYDKTWRTMKLDNCKIMVDKSKDDYIEPIEHGNIINNTIKQVEQITDIAQYKLSDYI